MKWPTEPDQLFCQIIRSERRQAFGGASVAPIPFAVYLYPEVAATSRPRETITFVGQSLPYFDQVRAGLADAVATYPALPLARADVALYRAVHDDAYLDA